MAAGRGDRGHDARLRPAGRRRQGRDGGEWSRPAPSAADGACGSRSSNRARPSEGAVLSPDPHRVRRLSGRAGLTVQLRVSVPTARRVTCRRRMSTFDVTGRREASGILGESGCGKSVTAPPILGLLPGSTDLSVAGASGSVTRTSRGSRSGARPGSRGPEDRLHLPGADGEPRPLLPVGLPARGAPSPPPSGSPDASRRLRCRAPASRALPEPEAWPPVPARALGGMAQRVAIARRLAGEPAC